VNDFLCVLKALGDETRFNIVGLLLEHDFCVRALAKKLEISEAAVSQHLQILRKAGIVKGEKRGYYTHYRVENEAFENTIDQLQEMIKANNAFKSNCRKHKVRKFSELIGEASNE